MFITDILINVSLGSSNIRKTFMKTFMIGGKGIEFNFLVELSLQSNVDLDL